MNPIFIEQTIFIGQPIDIPMLRTHTIESNVIFTVPENEKRLAHQLRVDGTIIVDGTLRISV